MMTEKEYNEIEYYVDVFELLNKPRRLFRGLSVLVDEAPEFDFDIGRALVKKIIVEMEKDFYEITLPKFEKRINEFWDSQP
jgi:hypothetical protein